MTLDKSKLSESEMKFITDIIDERHLWRTSMPIRTVYLMFGAITFVGVTWIVQSVLKVCNVKKVSVYFGNEIDAYFFMSQFCEWAFREL